MDKVVFIANNNIGDFGLSGGDRIFIELARGWKDRVKLYLIGCEEAITVSKREGINDIFFLKPVKNSAWRMCLPFQPYSEIFLKSLSAAAYLL